MDELEHLAQTEEYCAICNDVADGYHYGVLSCRGCNAFYRRAITHNLQFQCRRGGNCVIDKNARCACRACRLRKCQSVGMDKNAVQPRRDSKQPADLAPNHHLALAASTSRTESENGSLGGSSKSSPMMSSPVNSTFTPLSNLGPSMSYLLNGSLRTSASASLSPPQQSSCALTKMVEEYCEQRRRRRAMLCSTLEELLSDEGEIRLKAPAVPEDYSAIYRVQMILMFEWAEKLDEFKAISNPHDKARLLRVFSMKYLLLDNIFHTIELNYTDRLILVNNTYIHNGEIPKLPSSESKNIRKALSMMYGESCTSILEELVRPMIDMNITFGEILALRLIIFWNPGSQVGLTNETTQIIHRASEKAIEELHSWFDENRVTEVKTRLANVLLMLTPLAKHTQHLIELSGLIPNFGVLNEWDQFMQFLLRDSLC